MIQVTDQITNNITLLSIPNDISPIIQMLSVDKQREQAYANDRCIDWNNSLITVDEANQRFLFYRAEGDEVRSTELQVLIKSEKDRIRELYK
jgi:hypothetical protein